METKDRIEKAVELFKSGYNCSQSVGGALQIFMVLQKSRLSGCPPLLVVA